VAAFADDGKVTFAASGSASLKWGIDLNSSNTGFNSTSTSDLTVSLVSADAKTKGTDADGAAYGTITVSGLTVATKGIGTLIGVPSYLDSDGNSYTTQPFVVSNPSVSAKINLKPLYITIYNYNSTDLDYAAVIKTGTDVTGNLADDTYGTTIGVDLGGGSSVGVTLTSSTDWTATGHYMASLGATLAFAPITVNAGFNYDLGDSSMGLGAKVAAALAPLSVTVGFDGNLAGSVFSYDLAASASMAFMTASSAGVSFYMNDDATANKDLMVNATLAAADLGGFGLGVNFYMLDLANIMLDANVSMAIGTITPSVTFKYSEDVDGNYSANQIGLEVKAVIANIVPNVSLTIDYLASDLGSTNAGDPNQIGIATIALDIAL